MSLASRFWAKVDRRSDSECWPWLGAFSGDGYGCLKVDGKSVSAHRVAWIVSRGAIDDGVVVRHSCDNSSCVNPGHLVSGSHADNVADRVARNRGAIGERNGRAVLNDGAVIEIRGSSEPRGVLAFRHGVSKWTITQVRKGRTWRHLERAS